MLLIPGWGLPRYCGREGNAGKSKDLLKAVGHFFSVLVPLVVSGLFCNGQIIVNAWNVGILDYLAN